MMSTPEFAKAWEELSPIQQKAASWDEGALLVLAGPGSGKTRVLTCRIARLLNNSLGQKFRILGLTFTNKAADEMRQRVNEYVPGQQDRVFLTTFHSFCADVLRQHGSHLGVTPNFAIYPHDSDLQAVLNDAVREARKQNESITDIERKALPVIQRLKAYLITPDQAPEYFSNPVMGEKFASIYKAYEEQLSKRNALDFNSLILKAHELFEQFPVLANRYLTVYPYICIDEFQDTNEAQYQLFRSLVGKNYNNTFIVADDDQIIYQWNGADYKRIEEVIEQLQPTVIQLPVNYRCPPEIVELGNNLISHNFFRSRTKKPALASRSGSQAEVVRLLADYEDENDEAHGIVDDIIQYHRNDLASVVVLARTRRLLANILAVFTKRKIPAYIAQRKDNFESTPFIWLSGILRLANDRQDRRSLDAVCGAYSQLVDVMIDPHEVISQADLSNNDLLQNWLKIALNNRSNLNSHDILTIAMDNLVNGRNFQLFSSKAVEWFDAISVTAEVEQDPYLEKFTHFKEEKNVWLGLVLEIKRTLGNSITLDGFLQELQMRSKEPIHKKNTIALMTIHGAKGKEFKHVYLLGMVEDELPSYQSIQKGNDSPEMEEERRNCFVAITRPLETLTLSYANNYRGWTKRPSRFLFEMGFLTNEVPF